MENDYDNGYSTGYEQAYNERREEIEKLLDLLREARDLDSLHALKMDLLARGEVEAAGWVDA